VVLAERWLAVRWLAEKWLAERWLAVVRQIRYHGKAV